MYCTPNERRKARKAHKCTNCGQAIELGEKYVHWKSVEDGEGWFTSKMHRECYDDLNYWDGGGSWDYQPYAGERPNAELRGAAPNETKAER